MSTLSMWKFRAILLAFILAVAPLSVVLHAQDMEEAVVVNVPFAFGERISALCRWPVHHSHGTTTTSWSVRGETRAGLAHGVV